MAPPHVTKKSTTTTEQTVSRNGHRERRKHVFEELEEEEAEMMEVEAAAEPGDSTGTSGDKLADLMVEMVETQRKRHQVRKTATHNAYNKSHSSAQEAITTLFDDHEAKSSQAHEVQVARLRYLLAQKAKLEAAMSAKLNELQEDYVAHCRDIQKVAEHRVKELR